MALGMQDLQGLFNLLANQQMTQTQAQGTAQPTNGQSSVDSSGMIAQNQASVPTAPQQDLTEAILQGVNPNVTPAQQYQAHMEGRIAEAQNPNVAQQPANGQVGLQPSALSEEGLSAPEEQSGWQTFISNFTGNGNMSDRDYLQANTIGAVANRIGGAIAGENSLVGRVSNALGDMFTGNIIAKDAETKSETQEKDLSSLLSGMFAQALEAGETGRTGETGSRLPKIESPNVGTSNLSNSSFNAPQTENFFESARERLKNLMV